MQRYCSVHTFVQMFRENLDGYLGRLLGFETLIYFNCFCVYLYLDFKAVQEGRWVVVEDIDLAPMEVLSVFIPLLEKRQLFIPGRGEVFKFFKLIPASFLHTLKSLEAANGFQLFATLTLSPNSILGTYRSSCTFFFSKQEFPFSFFFFKPIF